MSNFLYICNVLLKKIVVKYVKYCITFSLLVTASNNATSDLQIRKDLFNQPSLIRVLKKPVREKMITYDTVYHYTYPTLYKTVRGTVYHPLQDQTDSTPLITADNSTIDTTRINEVRWVALSRNIIKRRYRDRHGKNVVWSGKIKLGDTIWVDYDTVALKKIAKSNKRKSYDQLKEKYEKVKGWWVVKDAMGAYYWKAESKNLSYKDLSIEAKKSGEYKVKNGILHKKFYQDTWIDFLQDHTDTTSMRDSWTDRVLILKTRKLESIELIKKEIEFDAVLYAGMF